MFLLFVEGFIAPFSELYCSMLLSSVCKILQATYAALPPSNAYPSVWLIVQFFYSVLSDVLVTFGVIDLVRNLALGILKIYDALAAVLGGIVSISLLVYMAASNPTAIGIFAESILDTILSSTLGIAFIVMGLIIRSYAAAA